jgi:DNA-binding NarL/FixJ family response regulator
MAQRSTFSPTSGDSSVLPRQSTRPRTRPITSLAEPVPSRLDGAWQKDAGTSEILANAGIALREAAKAAAEAAARARALAEGLDRLLAELTVTESRASTPDRTMAFSQRDAVALSQREREVLALVAEGHTNKAIADALFVSPNTVKTHVTSLLHKFHAETRAQLAAIATRQSSLLASYEHLI